MESVTLCVGLCVCVEALKGKQLELLTPNLVNIYSNAVIWNALTWRSTGQRSRSLGQRLQVATEVCCIFCCQPGTACHMIAYVSS